MTAGSNSPGSTSTHTLRCLVLKSSGSAGYGMRWNHSSFTPPRSPRRGPVSTTICDTDHVGTDNVRRDGRRCRPAAAALLRGRGGGAPLRPSGGPAARHDAAAVAAHPRARAGARRGAVRADQPAGDVDAGRGAPARRGARRAARRRSLHRHGGRAGRHAVHLDGRLLPRQRGRDDADDRRLSGRPSGRRGPRRRPHVTAHPRWPARRSGRRGLRPRSGRRPGSCRVRATARGSPSITSQSRPPIGWPAWRPSKPAISTTRPCSSSTAPDAPTAHDEIEAYCAARGARPALDQPRRRPGRARARSRGRGHGDRLAQRVAGGAGGAADRCRGATVACRCRCTTSSA